MTVEKPGTDVTRRGLIRGAAVGGITLPLLVACGGEDAATAPGGGGSDPTSAGSGSDAGKGAASLVSTADVPVGGGTILSDEMVVVTQPVEGDFKAFTAICTHQKCPVTEVTDGEIVCSCHGSHYSIEDGSVLAGPAPAPLAEVPVAVRGGAVVRS